MKNSLDGLISRTEMKEERVSELEDRLIGRTQPEQHRKERLKDPSRSGRQYQKV